VNVVTFHSELKLRHEYNQWRDILEKNVSIDLYFELVHCVIHKLIIRINCVLINEMFYSMHVLKIIITCKFIT
jgi:hypothetical protein